MLELALPMLSPGRNCGETGAKPNCTASAALHMGDILASSPPNEESPCPLLACGCMHIPFSTCKEIKYKTTQRVQ